MIAFILHKFRSKTSINVILEEKTSTLELALREPLFSQIMS